MLPGSEYQLPPEISCEGLGLPLILGDAPKSFLGRGTLHCTSAPRSPPAGIHFCLAGVSTLLPSTSVLSFCNHLMRSNALCRSLGTTASEQWRHASFTAPSSQSLSLIPKIFLDNPSGDLSPSEKRLALCNTPWKNYCSCRALPAKEHAGWRPLATHLMVKRVLVDRKGVYKRPNDCLALGGRQLLLLITRLGPDGNFCTRGGEPLRMLRFDEQ